MIKNVFFETALNQAARILGKKGRLVVLLGKLGFKLKNTNWKDVKAVELKEKFMVMGRLMKAYVAGHYRALPWKSLLLMTGAILYFVMPVDLIPDLVPALGLTDDFGILLAVYQSLRTDIDKFLAWEKTRLVAS
jgi:uncharacterized membrane protein YkvA (DUF1232 family)